MITRRNVDTGDLVDAGAGGGLARALFVVTQTDPLRLYVNVPQSYAQLIKVGQTVVVTQAELRGQKFEGKVARTGASIDTQSRTLQVEVSLPNKEGILLPGAFVQVSLPLALSRSLAVPNNALIIRGEGTMVAVVDDKNRVNIKPVQLGRNYGVRVEVMSGLEGGERLVLNPPDSLTAGDEVTFVAAEDDKVAEPAGSKGQGDAQKKKP